MLTNCLESKISVFCALELEGHLFWVYIKVYTPCIRYRKKKPYWKYLVHLDKYQYVSCLETYSWSHTDLGKWTKMLKLRIFFKDQILSLDEDVQILLQWMRALSLHPMADFDPKVFVFPVQQEFYPQGCHNIFIMIYLQPIIFKLSHIRSAHLPFTNIEMWPHQDLESNVSGCNSHSIQEELWLLYRLKLGIFVWKAFHNSLLVCEWKVINTKNMP